MCSKCPITKRQRRGQQHSPLRAAGHRGQGQVVEEQEEQAQGQEQAQEHGQPQEQAAE